MQVVNTEMKNDRTEEHSEYANGEKNSHSPHSVISDLKVIFAVQQKTTQDTCGAADDISHNIMDRCPLCEGCENQEIERCRATTDNPVQDEIPEFGV